MTEDVDHLRTLVEVWHRACTGFSALVRELSTEEGELPTDLAGWSVKDNVAHTAHLEAVLAGTPEETLEVPDAPHLRGSMSRYTEQGVLARRDRSLTELADEIDRAVSTRYAELRAAPPRDGSAAPPRTPGHAPWDTRTLLSNRPLDVWMHEQDVRRATGRPGGFDTPAAAHVLAVFGRALPMVVGKRLAAAPGTSVRVSLSDAGQGWTVRVGDNGRARFTDDEEDPTTSVTLTAEEFVVLAGGRRTPDATAAVIRGDDALGRRLLESLTVTP